MIEHYVTYFDYGYLPQGLALIKSMNRHVSQFKLWIFALDDDSYKFLSLLEMENIELLKIDDKMDDELLNLKNERSVSEFCWTITPHIMKCIFEGDGEIKRLTYLDADMWFRKSSLIILNEFELSNKDVLLTEHGYDKKYNQSNLSGKYCVQFMTFKRSGIDIIDDWDRCCREWCFDRFEDGKFGDQKYLEDWEFKFPNRVHIYSHNMHFQAPWSDNSFACEKSVLWHFHSLRIIYSKASIILIDCYGGYVLSSYINKKIYKEYLLDFKNAIKLMKNFKKYPRVQRRLTIKIFLRELLKNLIYGKFILPRKITKLIL